GGGVVEMLEHVGAEDEIQRAGRERERLAVRCLKGDRGVSVVAPSESDAQRIDVDSDDRAGTRGSKNRCPVPSAGTGVQDIRISGEGCGEPVEGLMRHEEIAPDARPYGFIERT